MRVTAALLSSTLANVAFMLDQASWQKLHVSLAGLLGFASGGHSLHGPLLLMLQTPDVPAAFWAQQTWLLHRSHYKLATCRA